MNVTGACGSECEGTTADTIGVYEYDTVTDTFIGSFNVKEGTGFGADPISSPDGKYVLLLPNDGGQFVRVIKAGANGQQSVRGLLCVAERRFSCCFFFCYRESSGIFQSIFRVGLPEEPWFQTPLLQLVTT